MELKLNQFVLVMSLVGIAPIFGFIQVFLSATFIGDEIIHKEAKTVFLISILAQALWTIVYLVVFVI